MVAYVGVNSCLLSGDYGDQIRWFMGKNKIFRYDYYLYHLHLIFINQGSHVYSW
jgi:hypothetical protein